MAHALLYLAVEYIFAAGVEGSFVEFNKKDFDAQTKEAETYLILPVPDIFRRLASLKMEFRQDIVITGIIMPNNWDENGRVIETALYTNTEDVYTVEQNSLTQELIKFMHARVEIKGKIRKHPDGKKSIAVRNYMVLEEIIDEEMKTH